MALPKGFDVVLDGVEDIGLSNRRLWKYKLKFGKKLKHTKICVDFDGELGNLSNPSNFDKKSATDHADFEWSGFETKTFRDPVDKSKKTKKTFVCLKAKGGKDRKPVSIDEGAEIDLRFIGPAKGKAGKVSLHSQTVGSIPNSNKIGLAEKTWGDKGSTEVPMAMVGEQSDEAEELPILADEVVLHTLDLETVVSAEAAELDEEALRQLPLSALTGLTAAKWDAISEITEAHTIGELVDHEAIDVLAKLRMYL